MIKNKINNDKTADIYIKIANKFLAQGEYIQACESLGNALNIKIESIEQFPASLQILYMVRDHYSIGAEFESVGDKDNATAAYLTAIALLDKEMRVTNQLIQQIQHQKEKETKGEN